MGEVVTTQWGKLEGEADGAVCVFRGVPYAKAPDGALRFRPPEDPDPWSGGVRSARRFGPSAPQSPPVMMLIRRVIGVTSDAQSQDCLNVNVWTPRADRGRRPVLVWLHGGAFIMGAGSTVIYRGAHLAERGDVVVVTLNYRLGALGFLNHPELAVGPDGVATNLGLRDQIAALEWVRDNIDAFGGDPENVTIFGESAGAMSVGTLLGTPSAKGLFQRAILQSGATHNVSSQAQASAVAEVFLGHLGVDNARPEALRKVSLDAILGAQRATSVEFGIGRGSLAWQPGIDGDLLPEHPLLAIERGLSASVPVLVGTKRDEWQLFMLGDPRALRLNEAGLQQRMASVLPGDDGKGTPLAARALSTYQGGERAGASPGRLWEAFQSDRVFHYPAQRLAAAHAQHGAGTFRYLFSWAPPLAGRLLGACHGMELPFVFGTVRERVLRPLFGLTRASLELSNHMQDAWIAFARDGHPGHERLPDWPDYDPAKPRSMILAGECAARRAPFQKECRFWEAHLGLVPG